VGVSKDCPNFLGTPFYLSDGKSYGFQIGLVYSERPCEHKPIKNFGEKEAGHIQGLSIFSDTPYYLNNG